MRAIRIELRALANISANIYADHRTKFLSEQKKAIHSLRNALLSKYFDQSITDEQILKSEHGKPYLASNHKLSFNHSHTKQNYALAMSQQVQDIGVDLEELNRKVRFESLAKHAFHDAELAIWQELDYDAEYWFKVWTTKEAVLKASGLGIRLNLNELNTNIHPNHDGGVCEHPQIGIFAFQNYQISGCMLTVAWRSDYSCKGFALPHIEIHSAP